METLLHQFTLLEFVFGFGLSVVLAAVANSVMSPRYPY